MRGGGGGGRGELHCREGGGGPGGGSGSEPTFLFSPSMSLFWKNGASSGSRRMPL